MSFWGFMRRSSFFVSICGGRGRWIRMAWTLGLLFNSLILFSSSLVVTDIGCVSTVIFAPM